MVASQRDLRIRGAAACLCQAVVTSAIPLILWFMFYKQHAALVYLAYIVWGASGAIFILGIVGFASSDSSVVGLHAVLAIAMGGGLGAFHTGACLLIQSRCMHAQISFAGCSACACAITSTCTKGMLSSEPFCGACDAIGTDVCGDLASSTVQGLLIGLGLVNAVVIAAPAVVSLQFLSRLECLLSSTSNRLQYARNVVSQELLSRAKGQQQISLAQPLLEELAMTLLAYGTEGDRASAVVLCQAAHLDISMLLNHALPSRGLESARMSGHRILPLPDAKVQSPEALPVHVVAVPGPPSDNFADPPHHGSDIYSEIPGDLTIRRGMESPRLHDDHYEAGSTDGADEQNEAESPEPSVEPPRKVKKSKSGKKLKKKARAVEELEEPDLPGTPK